MIDSKHSTIDDVKLIDLPKIHNRSGNITMVENNINLPFEIKRVYYLYDVPSGEERGGHAHKNLHQLIVSAGGSFDVLLFDGNKKKIINLNRPNIGLYLIPGLWRELINFSSSSICLVLASELYEEKDYIRDLNTFINFKNI